MSPESRFWKNGKIGLPNFNTDQNEGSATFIRNELRTYICFFFGESMLGVQNPDQDGWLSGIEVTLGANWPVEAQDVGIEGCWHTHFR